MDSVLTTTKKLLGIDADDDSFDSDICVGINSAIITLSQLGLEGKYGFIVVNEEQKWSDYLDDDTLLPMVQQYYSILSSFGFFAISSTIQSLTQNSKSLSKINISSLSRFSKRI